MARPTPAVDAADPYTPRHVRDALRIARRLAPRDAIARDVLVYLAACASRPGVLSPAPSLRRLAAELEYHTNTVRNALLRLERRGLIVWSRARRKRARIDLLFVIHTARESDEIARSRVIHTARDGGDLLRALRARAEEDPYGIEEPPLSIVCRDCGRAAAAGCALADPSLCELGNRDARRSVGGP